MGNKFNDFFLFTIQNLMPIFINQDLTQIAFKPYRKRNISIICNVFLPNKTVFL